MCFEYAKRTKHKIRGMRAKCYPECPVDIMLIFRVAGNIFILEIYHNESISPCSAQARRSRNAYILKLGVSKI